MLHKGSDFSLALADHLGLDPSKISADIFVRTGRDETFSVTVDVLLSADDLMQIGKLMKVARRE